MFLGVGLIGLAGVLWVLRKGMESTSPVEESTSPTTLHVPSASLHFGEVWEDKEFVWELPIENRGHADVKITGFRSSCGCSRVEPNEFTIPAGGSRAIQLVLDLTPKSGSDQGSTRDFDVLVAPQITSPGAAGNISWRLEGRVRRALQVNKEHLEFVTSERVVWPPGQSVIVTAAVALESLRATVTRGPVTADITADPKDRTRFVLTARPAPGLPRGVSRGEIQLSPKLPNGGSLPAKSIPVTVRTEPDIQAFPTVLACGARVQGEVVEETLQLSSMTKQAFSVVDIRVDGEGITAAPVKNEKSEVVYRVTQRVGQIGAMQGAITFRVREQGDREETVRVNVTYHGLAGATGTP